MSNKTELDHYNAPEYDYFGTSAEILAAIEKLAGDKFRCDPMRNADRSKAYRLWRDMSLCDLQRKQIVNGRDVIDAAWKLADPQKDELFWKGRWKRPFRSCARDVDPVDTVDNSTRIVRRNIRQSYTENKNEP